MPVLFPLLRLPSFGLLLSLAALILLEPTAEELRGGVPLLAVLHLSVLLGAVRLVSTHAAARWLPPGSSRCRRSHSTSARSSSSSRRSRWRIS